MTYASKTLGNFLSGFGLSDVPDAVRHEAKLVLLDSLGCLIVGAGSEMGPIARQHGEVFGESDTATVAGSGKRMSLMGAIYANGRMANAADYDETFPTGAHFGVSGIAATLAVCEQAGSSGKDVLLSLIAGYELGGRIANAIGPLTAIESGKVTGFPAVWGLAAQGVAAAAGATAKAMNFSGEEFANSIGVAMSNAPLPVGGLWSRTLELPNCKYNDAGWCAMTGAFSAIAARQGTTGYPEILDDPAGLLHIYGTDGKGAPILDADLGKVWMLEDMTYKPWPCCRLLHYPMTALERLLTTHSFDIDSIEAVVLGTTPLGVTPRFVNPSPSTFASYQFSFQHNVAMRLLDVPHPQWIDRTIDHGPKYADLVSKITIRQHQRGNDFAKSFERNQWRTMPASAEIVANGESFYAETEFALGDPWDESTRYDDEAVFAKFRKLTNDPKREEVIEAVMNLESLETLQPIMDLLRRNDG